MTDDLLKIVESGIELEKKGLITYLNFAHKTKSLTGKNMFIVLAKDEYEHMRELEKIRAAHAAGEPIPAVELPMARIESLRPKLKNKEQLIKGEEGQADLDALKIALDLERNARDFFKELAEAATDDLVRSFAERLVKWEEGHYDLVQAEIDYITQSGFYFDMQEFEMSDRY